MMATNFQEFKNIWCKSLSKVYLIRFMQTLNAYLDDSMQHLLDSRFLHSTHYLYSQYNATKAITSSVMLLIKINIPKDCDESMSTPSGR